MYTKVKTIGKILEQEAWIRLGQKISKKKK